MVRIMPAIPGSVTTNRNIVSAPMSRIRLTMSEKHAIKPANL